MHLSFGILRKGNPSAIISLSFQMENCKFSNILSQYYKPKISFAFGVSFFPAMLATKNSIYKKGKPSFELIYSIL